MVHPIVYEAIILELQYSIMYVEGGEWNYETQFGGCTVY
jgi:hypothetical protein